MNMVLLAVHWAFTVYYVMMIIYILSSWVPQIHDSPLVIFLRRLVEPYLAIFRSIIPPLGMIDLSPLVGFFTLYFVESGTMILIQWIWGILQ